MYLIIIRKIVLLIGFKRGLVLNNYGAALRQLEKIGDRWVVKKYFSWIISFNFSMILNKKANL